MMSCTGDSAFPIRALPQGLAMSQLVMRHRSGNRNFIVFPDDAE